MYFCENNSTQNLYSLIGLVKGYYLLYSMCVFINGKRLYLMFSVLKHKCL